MKNKNSENIIWMPKNEADLWEKMKNSPEYQRRLTREKWIQRTLKEAGFMYPLNNLDWISKNIFIKVNLLDENETIMQGDKKLGESFPMNHELLLAIMWGKLNKKDNK